MPDYLSVPASIPMGWGCAWAAVRLQLHIASRLRKALHRSSAHLLARHAAGAAQEVGMSLPSVRRLAAIRAEQERKAAGVTEFNPQASVRIGRNTTFMRVQFDWSVPPLAISSGWRYRADRLEWPVGIDLRDLAITAARDCIGGKRGYA